MMDLSATSIAYVMWKRAATIWDDRIWWQLSRPLSARLWQSDPSEDDR